MEKLKNIRFKDLVFSISVIIMLLVFSRVDKTVANIIFLSSFSSVILLYSLKRVGKVIEKQCTRVKQHKPRAFGPREKEIVSWHEAGHAIVSRVLFPYNNMEIDINPLSETCVGYVRSDEISYPRKAELVNKITILLAGMKAEILALGEHSTIASHDIKMAKKIAYDIIEIYGMGKNGVHVYNKDSDQITAEVNELIEECSQECEKILKKHSNVLGALSLEISVREQVNKEELNKFFKIYGI